MPLAAAVPAGRTPAAGPPRAVVCDDEPHIVQAVSLKLRKAGFEVDRFGNGADARDRVLADPPALIVTDCQMPRLSGLDLLRAVRADPAAAGVPAILLTGKGFELSDDELAAEVGPVRLMAKPFSPRGLLAAVRDLVPGA